MSIVNVLIVNGVNCQRINIANQCQFEGDLYTCVRMRALQRVRAQGKKRAVTAIRGSIFAVTAGTA